MKCKQCEIKETFAKSGLCRSCAQKQANEKRKKTMQERYGVDNPMQKKEFVDKIASTMKYRYGVKSAMNVPEFRKKFEDTCIERYGVPYFVETEEYRNHSQFRISEINNQFASLLSSTNIEYTQEFALEGKVFDFCLPEQNILIEIDPSYTHNTLGNHWNPQGLDAKYHINKTRIAEEHGYRCIHVFDWDDMQSIVDMLTITSMIYARNCVVYEVDTKIADRFLKENHLQGSCKGQLICLGLYHEENLVEIMTFGKPRYNRKFSWELLRLCTKKFTRVMGGASKLFKYAVERYSLSNIISYCDKSKFSGKIYEQLGMKLFRHSQPQEIWSRGNDKITANLLRQRGFDQLFHTNYGKGTSNEQLMIDNGWLPVYDCGQLVFSYRHEAQPEETDTDSTISYEELKKRDDRKKAKICEFCGKEFQPRSNFQRYCKGPHIRICPACGKEYEEKNSENLKKPPHACSYACRTILTKRTSLEKYGCVAPGNSPEARKKASQTMMDKLGVPYAMMSKDVRHKSKETMLERYGVENAAQSSELLEKRLQANRDNHGGILSFNTAESYKNRSKTVQTNRSEADELIDSAEHCRVIHKFLTKYKNQEVDKDTLETYHKNSRLSYITESFENKLKKHNIIYTSSDKTFNRWFDFYLPDKQIVIELDHTSTHNSAGFTAEHAFPNDYHLAKTDLAKEFGLRCIHVFDWDDWGKIIDMLKDRKPIYARKCKVHKLNPAITNSFLNEYHLQGTCRGQLLSLGLVYNDELVQVMTFGKPRYDKKYNVELLRLATKAGYQVVGGASKLFSYATKQIELNSIISYCNVSKFSGSVYEQIGMKLVRITEPQEIWSRDSDYVTANYLRQRGYDQIFHTSYGKGTSNEQLMLEHNWLPIYDCGQYVFEFS